MIILTYIGYGFASIYALWLFYLAVMNLKRAKDDGKLTRTAYAFGLPILLVGYTLDFLVNVIVLSVIFLELPKEGLVTARLKRHYRYSTGWRRSVAMWFAFNLLDAFDPSGRHI